MVVAVLRPSVPREVSLPKSEVVRDECETPQCRQKRKGVGRKWQCTSPPDCPVVEIETGRGSIFRNDRLIWVPLPVSSFQSSGTRAISSSVPEGQGRSTLRKRKPAIDLSKLDRSCNSRAEKFAEALSSSVRRTQ